MSEEIEDAKVTIMRIKERLLNEMGSIDESIIVPYLNELIQLRIKEIIQGQIFLCKLPKLFLMEKLLNDKGMEESRSTSTEEGTTGVRKGNNKKKPVKEAD